MFFTRISLIAALFTAYAFPTIAWAGTSPGTITGLTANAQVIPSGPYSLTTVTVNGKGMCYDILFYIDGKMMWHTASRQTPVYLPYTTTFGVPNGLANGINHVSVTGLQYNDCSGTAKLNIAVGNLSGLGDVFKPLIESVKTEGALFAYQGIDFTVGGYQINDKTRCAYEIQLSSSGKPISETDFTTFGIKYIPDKTLAPGTYHVAAVPTNIGTTKTIAPCAGSASADFTLNAPIQ